MSYELNNFLYFSDADMWAWLTGVFEPNVLNKDPSLFYDNSNSLNVLLGQARLRQQRSIPAGKTLFVFFNCLRIFLAVIRRKLLMTGDCNYILFTK